jgi:hypothetical protein
MTKRAKRFFVASRAPTQIRQGCFPPDEVEPPHHVVDPQQQQELVQNMRKHGWTGRPLVVYAQPSPRRRRITRKARPELDPFDFEARERFVEARRPGRYRAITGSHRVAAARRAGIQCIPSIVLNKKAVTALLRCGALDKHGNLQEALPGYLSECLRSRKEPQQRVAQLVALGGL